MSWKLTSEPASGVNTVAFDVQLAPHLGLGSGAEYFLVTSPDNPGLYAKDTTSKNWFRWVGTMYLNDHTGAQGDGTTCPECPPIPSAGRSAVTGGVVGAVVGGIAGYLMGRRK